MGFLRSQLHVLAHYVCTDTPVLARTTAVCQHVCILANMCSSVHIGLEASMETDVTLLVSYVVTNASWSPAYDVRVFPITKEMKVSTILGTIHVHRGGSIHTSDQQR